MNSSINSTLANSVWYDDLDMSMSLPQSDVQEAWRPFQDALAGLEVVQQRNRSKLAPVKSYETTVHAMIRPWPELYEVLIFAWGGAHFRHLQALTKWRRASNGPKSSVFYSCRIKPSMTRFAMTWLNCSTTHSRVTTRRHCRARKQPARAITSVSNSACTTT
ncbi:MAG: hypothetical protein KAF64_11940 [Hydrogenophaga sp.]|uniref:hypothetical protein n=1 Tax=Hydrogenophaga sp. TaxID=1904254 RepID=UPI0025C12E41|nr:hypothetical protein [Hydrogenophaga sp.]MBU7574059.1 hypothetical protein [Hydrogenophaga sp.]